MGTVGHEAHIAGVDEEDFAGSFIDFLTACEMNVILPSILFKFETIEQEAFSSHYYEYYKVANSPLDPWDAREVALGRPDLERSMNRR